MVAIEKRSFVMDAVYIGLTVLMLVAVWGLARACAHLQSTKGRS